MKPPLLALIPVSALCASTNAPTNGGYGYISSISGPAVPVPWHSYLNHHFTNITAFRSEGFVDVTFESNGPGTNSWAAKRTTVVGIPVEVWYRVTQDTSVRATYATNTIVVSVVGDNHVGCATCAMLNPWKPGMAVVVVPAIHHPWHPDGLPYTEATEKWETTQTIRRETATFNWRGRSVTLTNDVVLGSVTNRWKLTENWVKEQLMTFKYSLDRITPEYHWRNISDGHLYRFNYTTELWEMMDYDNTPFRMEVCRYDGSRWRNHANNNFSDGKFDIATYFIPIIEPTEN